MVQEEAKRFQEEEYFMPDNTSYLAKKTNDHLNKAGFDWWNDQFVHPTITRLRSCGAFQRTTEN